MQKLIVNVVISFFVIIGAQLVAFSLLVIVVPLWQSIVIAAIFTLVSTLLGWHQGEHEWTPNESETSSTTEIASTAS